MSFPTPAEQQADYVAWWTANRAAIRAEIETTARLDAERAAARAAAEAEAAKPSPADVIQAQWDEIERPHREGWQIADQWDPVADARAAGRRDMRKRLRRGLRG